MKTKFNLDKEAINRTVSFGNKIYKDNNQSNKDFATNEARDPNDSLADTINGKLAEEAFRLFLRNNYNIMQEIDYVIYPGTRKTDGGKDFTLPGGFKVDVKGTRNYSQWLLETKFKFDRYIPDIYVLVKNTLPRNFENNPLYILDQQKSVSSLIVGYVHRFELFDSKGNYLFLFNQNDSLFKLPSSFVFIKHNRREFMEECRDKIILMDEQGVLKKLQVRLKAKANVGFPIQWLRKSRDEWEDIINGAPI